MPDDSKGPIGMRVRLLPEFYVTRVLPPKDWAGTIVAEIKYSMGQRIKYRVLLDDNFHVEAEAREVDASEEEMEQCE
jgi:hypothetical protein